MSWRKAPSSRRWTHHDRARIRTELEALLDDWRNLLTQHVLKSRQILRKLLTKRLGFVPERQDGVRGYRLEAEGTVRPLFTDVRQVPASAEGADSLYETNGIVQNVASLVPASWNQIASWLKQIDNLRQAA